MKRILLVLFVLISLNSYSQLQVKEGSFKHNPRAVIEDKAEYVDGNDLPMALIKISTENISEQERLRLVFSGNRATQILKEPKTGQMWIYLSAEAATFIDIKHPDYGTYKYFLPERLCDYCVYEMVLQYVNLNVGYEQEKPNVNYLVISSDQKDAEIFIDDEFVGVGEVSRSFVIGSTHTWKIECKYYHAESGSVTIPSGDAVVIDKTLRPAYGFIKVESQPEGAILYIDDERMGRTPYVSGRLMSGEYSVKVVKEMYKPAEQKVVVADGKTTTTVLNMVANFVDVTIKTDSQSDIYLDNEYKGKGTWIGRLPEGAHYVEARKTSHQTTAKNISLVLGKDVTIEVEAPKPINGHLDLNSNPMRADIYIDGKHYGQTPRIITDLLIGKHEVKLQKQGCAPLTKTIEIEEGETLSLNETLQTGKEITIITQRNGDKIYVDNDYLGTSPVTVNLSYGTHRVKAVRDDQTVTKDFEVAGGSASEVVVAFGKMVAVYSSSTGDDVYLNDYKIGETPLSMDLTLGKKYEIEVRRGAKKEVKTLNADSGIEEYLYFNPRKETYKEYFSNGVHFVTANANMSFITKDSLDLHYGLTYGIFFTDKIGDGIGLSASLSTQSIMASLMLGFLEAGVGLDKKGVLLSAGFNMHFKRLSVFTDFVFRVEDYEYSYGASSFGIEDIGVRFGIGYNFKMKGDFFKEFK